MRRSIEPNSVRSAHKVIFDKLGLQLGLKSMEDWYGTTTLDFYQNGAGSILGNSYNNSPSSALLSVYPEHKWELEKFHKKPNGFWKDKQNHRWYFDKLYNQLGYNCMEDWYNLTHDDVVRHGGGGLVNKYYNCSPSSALLSVYPEHKWELEKFENKPLGRQRNLNNLNTDKTVHSMGFWKIKENQKHFFDSLMVKLGYTSMDDWYNSTVEDVHKSGGGGILSKYYNNSPSSALLSVYPEHSWHQWRFKISPKGCLSMMDDKEITKMVNWLSGQLCIKSLEDWYRVSLAQISTYINIRLGREFGKMLQIAYPQHQWDENLFGRLAHPKATQRQLVRAIQQLFPNQRVEEDYQHPQMFYSSGHNIELDVFIGPLKLALEYHGEQHYRPVYWMTTNFAQQLTRDEEKRRACQKVQESKE